VLRKVKVIKSVNSFSKEEISKLNHKPNQLIKNILDTVKQNLTNHITQIEQFFISLSSNLLKSGK